MRKVVHEAYLLKKGIAILPTVTTSFFENQSSTSVILNGNIIEDGGAEVSEQGMAWGNSYKPTIENEKIISTLGLDIFSVTLDGLTEGETYYARTYAINSVGISYGNCISFVAQTIVGNKTNNLNEGSLEIFPNPANEHVNIALSQEFDKENLCIYDVQGRIVAQKAIADFNYKGNTIRINVSGLKNGFYYCRVDGTSGDIVSGKFQVVH